MATGCERGSIGTRLVKQSAGSATDIRQALNESLQAVSGISLPLKAELAASAQVAMSLERVAQIVEENSAVQGAIVQAILGSQAVTQRTTTCSAGTTA
jgi:methyl-accepting chemotaxis protein